MTVPPSFDTSGFSTDPGATRIEKPWGYEVLLTPKDAPYAFKLIHVKAGKRLSLQIHDVKVETQTLIDGNGFPGARRCRRHPPGRAAGAGQGVPHRRRTAAPPLCCARSGRDRLRGLDA